MKHYGDITKINGAEVPIVDVICGGSPCQDLSVAGKRAGLDGERSGLFMEQIRIVKEQRDECIRQLQLRGADIDVRSIKPRYLIWENVPGAFSSNKGEDFRCVLEEICRIADKTANVPMPEKGKWSTSGCIVGNGWSVAWRVHDAQFWGKSVIDNTGRVVKMGTPQRRRRISVVADFGSESIGEILFERESVSGDIEQSLKEREEVAGTIGDSTPQASNVFGDEVLPTLVSRAASAVGNTQDGFNVISFQERAGCPGGGKGILIQDDKTASIRTQNNQSVCYGFEPGAAKRLNPDERFNEEKSPTLRANMGDNQVGVLCYGMDNERRRGPEEHDDESPTITAKCGTGGNNVPVVIEGNGSRPSHQGDGYKESEISYTLNSTEVHGVCASVEPIPINTMVGTRDTEEKRTTMGVGEPGDPQFTISAAHSHAVCTSETVNVEVEVSVRKYEVDKGKLKECLQSHKFMTMQEIADKLGKPKTLVEHWFRNDESFAIPDPEIWIDLKSLLGIETNEFDESIMTFETKPGNYDMRNRIHVGDVSPTLKAGSGNDIHLVEEPVLLATNQNDAEISQTGICNTLPAAMGMGGGYVPMITDTYQKTTGALCASGYDKLGTQEAMNDMYVVSSYGVDSYNQTASEEVAETLKTNGGGDNTPKVCTTYGLDRASFNQGQNAKFDFSIEEELAPTLVNRGPGGVLTKQ